MKRWFRNIFLSMGILSSVITPTSVYAQVYIQEPQFKDSVYIIPNTREDTITQTGTVYATVDFNKKGQINFEKPIGVVFKAQQSESLFSPTGKEKEDYIPEGRLRETTAIPLGEGEIWVYGNEGKKEIIGTEIQVRVKNFLEYLNTEKLKEKLNKNGVDTGKLTEVELLDCKQVAIIELLEGKEYKSSAITKEKRNIVNALKKMSETHFNITEEKEPTLQIKKFTDTELVLNRTPNNNEFLYLNGQQIIKQKTKLDPNTLYVVSGYVRHETICYFKDLPNMRSAEGSEKECRDSIGVNYVGFVEQPYKTIAVENEKLVFKNFKPENDILETNKYYIVENKVKLVLCIIMFIHILILGLFVFLSMWVGKGKCRDKKHRRVNGKEKEQ